MAPRQGLLRPPADAPCLKGLPTDIFDIVIVFLSCIRDQVMLDDALQGTEQENVIDFERLARRHRRNLTIAPDLCSKIPYHGFSSVHWMDTSLISSPKTGLPSLHTYSELLETPELRPTHDSNGRRVTESTTLPLYAAALARKRRSIIFKKRHSEYGCRYPSRKACEALQIPFGSGRTFKQIARASRSLSAKALIKKFMKDISKKEQRHGDLRTAFRRFFREIVFNQDPALRACMGCLSLLNGIPWSAGEMTVRFCKPCFFEFANSRGIPIIDAPKLEDLGLQMPWLFASSNDLLRPVRWGVDPYFIGVGAEALCSITYGVSYVELVRASPLPESERVRASKRFELLMWVNAAARNIRRRTSEWCNLPFDKNGLGIWQSIKSHLDSHVSDYDAMKFDPSHDKVRRWMQVLAI